MTDLVFAIPGDLATPTGGYAYDRRVLALLPGLGVTARHLALPGSFPMPDAADLEATAKAFAAVPDSAVLMVDGLAYGALPEAVIAAARAPIIALVHHPLGLESGLSVPRRDALLASEHVALSFARAIVATSRVTAAMLTADFGVPAQAIVVAEPGTDPRAPATGSAEGAPLSLLSVGAVVPRKGYDVLVEALAPLRDRAWHLTIAGATDRAPDHVADLRARIAAADLGGRVTLTGALSDDALDTAWRAADLFILSSRFEGYGMVLAEAMAYGLPIVATTGGAAAETVPDAAAIKVAPDDAPALSAALASAIDDREARARLREAARLAAATLPRWEDTAACIADVIKKVAREATRSSRMATGGAA